MLAAMSIESVQHPALDLPGRTRVAITALWTAAALWLIDGIVRGAITAAHGGFDLGEVGNVALVLSLFVGIRRLVGAVRRESRAVLPWLMVVGLLALASGALALADLDAGEIVEAAVWIPCGAIILWHASDRRYRS